MCHDTATTTKPGTIIRNCQTSETPKPSSPSCELVCDAYGVSYTMVAYVVESRPGKRHDGVVSYAGWQDRIYAIRRMHQHTLLATVVASYTAARILHKLGPGSRAQAATWATKRALLRTEQD